MIRLCIPGAALLLASLAAAPAGAQSLQAARSLGYPLDPIDARARGLGGVAVGLPDPQLSLVNPAAVAGLPAAGLSVTFQGDEFTPDGEAEGVSTARFPAIQTAFPIGERLVVSLGYAGVLDQSWQATVEDSLDIAGERRFVQDRFVSRGGLSRFRLGGAYSLVPRLDVGVGVDIYTGALRDSVTRAFPDGGLFPSVVGTEYQYDGLGLSVGARYRGEAYTVSAAVTGGGDLTAQARDSAVESRAYALPLTLDAGGSARIARNTLVATSFRWSRWSSASEALSESGGARDVMQAGAGLEYEALRLLGRPFPLRLGARWAQLPFGGDGEGAFPEERTLTGGFGLIIAGGAATADLSAERGTRDGGDAAFNENFWRVSFTLSLLGR